MKFLKKVLGKVNALEESALTWIEFKLRAEKLKVGKYYFNRKGDQIYVSKRLAKLYVALDENHENFYFVDEFGRAGKKPSDDDLIVRDYV